MKKINVYGDNLTERGSVTTNMDVKTFIETNYNAKFIDIFRNYVDWENMTCYSFSCWYVYGNMTLGV